MTGLLVSVRDGREAQAATGGGADLVDVKEPDRGSLGRADGHVWDEVARVLGGRVPLSVALGELLELRGPIRLPPAVHFAKAGLAGCRPLADWPARLAELARQLPPTVKLVAVAYADWRAARAPRPLEVIHAAARCGCTGLLIDTCYKNAGGLFDHLPQNVVVDLVLKGQRALGTVVLAGSLRADTVPQAAACGPDYVAVRGAVCRGGRTGELDGQLVSRLAALIARSADGPEAFGRPISGMKTPIA